MPKVGDQVLALGFPLNQNFQPIPATLGTANALGGRWAATSAFDHGMSGGPVYSNNFVVGLVKGGLEGTNSVQWITPIGHAKTALATAVDFSEQCTVTQGSRGYLNIHIGMNYFDAQKLLPKSTIEKSGDYYWLSLKSEYLGRPAVYTFRINGDNIGKIVVKSEDNIFALNEFDDNRPSTHVLSAKDDCILKVPLRLRSEISHITGNPPSKETDWQTVDITEQDTQEISKLASNICTTPSSPPPPPPPPPPPYSGDVTMMCDVDNVEKRRLTISSDSQDIKTNAQVMSEFFCIKRYWENDNKFFDHICATRCFAQLSIY